MSSKNIIVTGGAQGIGKHLVKTFEKLGHSVSSIDILDNEYYVGDLSNPKDVIEYAQYVESKFNTIDCIIFNANPGTVGLLDGSLEEYSKSLSVGLISPFIILQQLRHRLTSNACIIFISSTRAQMSQPNTESYSAVKGGTESLVHALAQTLKGSARVNCIAPGWINTSDNLLSNEDNLQHTSGRVGKPEDISNLALFLMDEKNSFINGQTITIDGGMSKTMVYHGDYGWTYNPK